MQNILLSLSLLAPVCRRSSGSQRRKMLENYFRKGEIIKWSHYLLSCFLYLLPELDTNSWNRSRFFPPYFFPLLFRKPFITPDVILFIVSTHWISNTGWKVQVLTVKKSVNLVSVICVFWSSLSCHRTKHQTPSYKHGK